MSYTEQTDLQQLTEAVARLSDTVAAGERRQAAASRAIRWVAIAVIVVVGGGIYAASDMIKAYAAQAMNWDQIEQGISQQPPSLGGILQSLMATKELQGTVVKAMQSASTLAAMETQSYLQCVADRNKIADEQQRNNKLCFSRAAVEDLGEFYLDANGLLPTPPGPNSSQQEQMAYGKKMMEATLMAAGQVIVDSGALLHRVRRDSDLLRNTVDQIGGVNEMLGGINEKLAQLNGMMTAIPAMATEMHVMNGQMSIMAHGVGSTMGRMGNIMPW